MNPSLNPLDTSSFRNVICRDMELSFVVLIKLVVRKCLNKTPPIPLVKDKFGKMDVLESEISDKNTYVYICIYLYILTT